MPKIFNKTSVKKPEKIFSISEKVRLDVTPLFTAFSLGILLTLGAIFLLSKSGVSDFDLISLIKNIRDTGGSATEENWKKPASNSKGYPIVDNKTRELKVFDINTLTLKNTGIEVLCCGGSVGYGNTDPLPSPNLNYTAYIDFNTKDLWFLSNQNFKKESVSKGQAVNYISGWSKDGKYLVYYIQEDTLKFRKDGPAEWETVEKFTQQEKSGFYLFDTTNGKTTNLSPIQYFVGFVDGDEFLARTSAESERLVVFDVENFVADYALITEDFGFGVSQFDFSQSGNKWVFTYSQNPTQDANIVYADFPKKNGVFIDSGVWAEVQWPVISHDGKRVTYQKTGIDEQTGEIKNYIWLYDSEAREENTTQNDSEVTDSVLQDAETQETAPAEFRNPKKIGEGTPIMWASEQYLITEQLIPNESGMFTKVKVLLDLETQKVLEIY